MNIVLLPVLLGSFCRLSISFPRVICAAGEVTLRNAAADVDKGPLTLKLAADSSDVTYSRGHEGFLSLFPLMIPTDSLSLACNG